MQLKLSTAIGLGKTIRYMSRLFGHNGAALPGLVVEKLVPNFLAITIGNLPDGIVIVTGTNGKTTTTKIITDLLRANGKQVLTNKTGSNFTRGIVATVVEQISLGKELPHDIAVIELDEAYAKLFVKKVQPNYVVALNVMRDQLDRFGEIDTTAKLIGAALQTARNGIIINADDKHLRSIAQSLTTIPAYYYGVAAKLRKLFPSDEELAAVDQPPEQNHNEELAVELHDFTGQLVTYNFGRIRERAELKLAGQYNFQNAAAALALVRQLLPKVAPVTLLKQLSHIAPAFGRGEVLSLDGSTIELVLVKNPAGFRQSLLSFTQPATTMIAINDNDPDGRDISWLWDVNFASLMHEGVAITTGRRASDMALRLQYDNVKTQLVEPDLQQALASFLALDKSELKRIYCNYTAMLRLRALLGRPEHGDYDVS